MSRLSELIEKLVENLPPITDPFEEGYFDKEEYERQRVAAVPAMVDEAIRLAKEKQAKEEAARAQLPQRQTFKEDRHW